MSLSRPGALLADRPVLLLLLAASFWAAGNIALKATVSEVGPLMITALRCLLAAAVLTPLLRPERGLLRDARWWRGALPVVACFAIGMSLQSWGFVVSTASDAAFLMNALVVFTPILAWAALRQVPGPAVGVSALLVLGGAWALMGMPVNAGQMLWADGWILVSALAYAVWHVLLGQHLARSGGPWATTWLGMALSGAVLLPLSIVVEEPDLTVILPALPLILFLGVVGTALPYVFCAQAQLRVSAPVAVLLIASESVLTALFAALILAERMTALDLVGAGLILIATVLTALFGAPRTRPVARAGVMEEDCQVQG